MYPDRCRADTDEHVPSFDVPDDALERAAYAADMAALTWNFCTYNYFSAGRSAAKPSAAECAVFVGSLTR
jgi:hypothetical protein